MQATKLTVNYTNTAVLPLRQESACHLLRAVMSCDDGPDGPRFPSAAFDSGLDDAPDMVRVYTVLV